MTGGWVKLYATILDSSVWGEAPGTRLVWITMLAMCDAEGKVEASESGLARRANVTIPECRKALETLAAPDLESKSKEWGGRRIEMVDGGWLVLNYQKYREMRSPKQVADAERQAKWRAGNKRDTLRDVTVTEGNVAPTVDVDAAVDTAVTTTSGADVENLVESVEKLNPAPLVVAANKGLEAHPKRPQRIPRILPGQNSTVEAVEKLLLAGVPQKFAESALYEIGKGHNSDSEIRSLLYFVPGTIRRYEEHRQAIEMVTTATPAALSSSSGGRRRDTAEDRERARERERTAEFETARRDRAYAKARSEAVAVWAKVHPTEHSTIVEEVKKEMAGIGPMSETTIAGMVDMTCVERHQVFPAIEDWSPIPKVDQ